MDNGKALVSVERRGVLGGVTVERTTPLSVNEARPDTLSVADTYSLAEIFAKAGYFRDNNQPLGAAQAVVKMLRGRELGIGPVASLEGISFVMGKMTLSAGLIASLIQRSGRFSYRIVEHNDQMCAIDFFDGGQMVGTSTFTMDDAKKADLLKSGMYGKFPRNMLFARALSNGAKWFCAGIFGGPVYTPDELMDAPPVVDLGPVAAASVTASTGGITLDDLSARYGDDAVFAAAGNRPPLPEEAAELAAKLELAAVR